MSEGKVIHFDDKDKNETKEDAAAVDHEVQYIPANINHNGSQEVNQTPKFSLTDLTYDDTNMHNITCVLYAKDRDVFHQIHSEE